MQIPKQKKKKKRVWCKNKQISNCSMLERTLDMHQKTWVHSNIHIEVDESQKFYVEKNSDTRMHTVRGKINMWGQKSEQWLPIRVGTDWKGYEGTLEGVETFSLLIGVLATHVFTFVKTHLIISLHLHAFHCM